ncbi:hypothetical protein WR25_22411 [Diploscapter pachys]|uniref:RRM domain-containing protein n=1 Tax=Diploscapter pachys TaxID=2018661 RepID=A0A2A2JJB3_9BILA|nr:hypothetical protein WR25_22411 [Diploscapter pachys]
MTDNQENTANGSGTAYGSEPDPDTIKMFVGQIPRHWNEPECRKLFERYGPVFSLNILRDRSSQQSKGCCFVTYYHRKDAIEAQGAMHNVVTIEGMHHPVQMKPADTENRNDRKLFVGQLCKKFDEDDVRAMFQRFGTIEDCSVLRDLEGKSRGCAFVTYTSRSFAVNATKEMHHSQTMEGCSAPLVVKFADTQKDKDVKAKGSVSPVVTGLNSANILQQFGAGGTAGLNMQQLAALLTLLQGNNVAQQPQNNVLALLGSVLSALGKLSEVSSAISSGSSNSSTTTTNNSPPNNSTTMGSASVQNLQLAGGTGQTSQNGNQQQQIQQQLAALLQQQAAALQPQVSTSPQLDALAQLQQTQQLALALQQQQQQQASPSNSLYSLQSQVSQADGLYVAWGDGRYESRWHPHSVKHEDFQASRDADVCERRRERLPATLGHFNHPAAATQAIQLSFLGGLPTTHATSAIGNGDDFDDSHLLQTFAPFGSVLSAKVFIDKVTNLSKCFGFVSYDNAISAAKAIQAMNGFQIGSKRLKVQLKTDRSHPYNKT